MKSRLRKTSCALPVFVINLDSRPDKWRLQALQARVHGLDLHRVAAKDGRAGRARFPMSTLTDGATGLWHSFDDLVGRLAEEGVPVAVVLEDDAILMPGFTRNVLRVLRSASSTVALVQLGFLTESSWRPQNSVMQNLRKILRPRSRVRALVADLKSPSQVTSLGLKAGTHALLIFPANLREILPTLRPDRANSEPLDNALVTASREQPDVLFRVRHSMAFQLPLKSDIAWIRQG